MASSSSQDLPLAANHHPAAHDHGHTHSPQPPPLPPRNPPSTGVYSARPDPSLMAMISKDPRSSSQQSLGVESDQESSGRRRLLLVFIHGFLGDETSFRSFPAHLHNLTAITFAETHVVRTKIYPKYRSRYSLDVARDAFSNWLTPHEDQFTDIVLLSHSMGGLVAADIALLFRHNIIGIINFDVPFVGMHPGIIKAGLGSIFKPWPTPEENLIAEAENSTDISSGTGKKPSRMSTLFNPKPTDPNYNPSFYNDVHLPVRKGWENTLHWMHKHSNGIIKASRDLVKSHIDFGGAMADYKTLKARYARIRALEEDDENQRRSANPEVRHPPRIRFVNYYTTSTGRPKKQKTAKSPSPSRPGSRGGDSSIGAVASLSQASLALQTPTTIDTNISPNVTFEVEEHRGDQVVPVPVEAPLSVTTPNAKPLERSPFFEKEQEQQAPSLPEVPPIPQEPPFVDLAEFTDKAQRKAAEKEHDQALDEYRKAVKARNKVINERSKILEKWEKQKQKDQLQVQKLQESELQQLQQRPQNPKETKSEVMPDTIVVDSANDSDSLDEDFGAMQLGTTGSRAPPGYHTPYRSYTFSQSIIMNQSEPDEHASLHSTGHSSFTDSTYTLETVPSQSNSDPEAPPKKKRLRKFCMLPPKDAYGNKDPTWVQVFMEDVDEVAAHTTLFFMSDTYERLVGDVASRIEDWVREAESIRLIRDLEGI